jgi:hypothetical protein
VYIIFVAEHLPDVDVFNLMGVNMTSHLAAYYDLNCAFSNYSM